MFRPPVGDLSPCGYGCAVAPLILIRFAILAKSPLSPPG
jgi:hypothetical protein